MAGRLVPRDDGFFGVLRILAAEEEAGETRVMIHGTISHGSQFVDPARRHLPTT